MKAYTIENGKVIDGIGLRDGIIFVGESGLYAERPVTVTLDSRCEALGGRLVSSPGRGALLLIHDHSGEHGSWYVRASQPDTRWDAMVATERIPNALDRIIAAERVRSRYPHKAPIGWHEFSRGFVTVDIGARKKVNVYGYIECGASFEIRRRGAICGTPSVYLVACDADGTVTVADPREAALARISEAKHGDR